MFSEGFISILNSISKFQEINNGHVWYRGHSINSHKLNSGLFRLKYPSLCDYLNLEKQQIQNLIINYHLLDIDNEFGNLDLLYIMQHYGIRTRLLDWSSNLSVALYFLSLEWTSNNPSRLWLINPITLNTISTGISGIISPQKYTMETIVELKKTIAIYPIKNNKRIIAQQGQFTIQGNSMLCLEDEFGCELQEKNALAYIDLDFDLKQDIINYLNLHGINSFTVFPDMQGFKDYINDLLIPNSAK